MGTYTHRVDASSDDAEQLVASPFTMDDTTSSDLELHDKGDEDGYVGMRFHTVTIPKDATIDDAKIQFHVDELKDNSSLTVTFRGEAIDNAPTFNTDDANISDRAETTASVDWAIPAWTVVSEEGADQLSADLKTIIQEIVNRAGWNSGQAFVIMIKAWSGSGERIAESQDGSSPDAPIITVNYTTGTTTTKTIAGKARIEKSVTKTIAGLSRIEKSATQTTTGKSRIEKSVGQTITGKSRIEKAVLQTIQGLSRIQKAVLQTITGKSRIQKVVAQTITGLSRIQKSVLQTITGKASISAEVTTTKTITAKSRIQKAVLQTIQGLARIQKAVLQTITAKSRIQKVVGQTITGKSRMESSIPQTITGKANIDSPRNYKFITGKAKIIKIGDPTIVISAVVQSVVVSEVGASVAINEIETSVAINEIETSVVLTEVETTVILTEE